MIYNLKFFIYVSFYESVEGPKINIYFPHKKNIFKQEIFFYTKKYFFLEKKIILFKKFICR